MRTGRRNILRRYLESGGAQGHVLDLSGVGGRSFTTHCLIRYTGRKSGQSYIKPLIYGNVGGEIVVVASKGGADNHPEWYLNIESRATLEVQVATERSKPPGANRRATNGTRCGSTCATCIRRTSPISSHESAHSTRHVESAAATEPFSAPARYAGS